MKILIVDDEKPARKRLIGLIQELDGEFSIAGEAANGVDAIEQIGKKDIDLVLLDIRMPVMDGLDAAREIARIPHPPVVIFVTAYDQYALDAFDANAVDYLLKPIRDSRLKAALEKAKVFNLSRWKALELSPLLTGRIRTHVAAHSHGEVELLAISDIRYFHADRKYVLACSRSKQLLIDDSLKSLEQEFSGLFIRVHRNALVAVNYIRSVQRDGNGRLGVKLDGIDQLIGVSRRHVVTLRNALSH